jgi:hypothetical protein
LKTFCGITVFSFPSLNYTFHSKISALPLLDGSSKLIYFSAFNSGATFEKQRSIMPADAPSCLANALIEAPSDKAGGA